ncbi:MAG: C2 domain-containing protein [Hyphomicrobium sp.]
MLGLNLKPVAARVPAMAAALLALPMAITALTPMESQAETANRELTVTISNAKALDKADEFSNGDLYAKITIDGEAQKTPAIKGDNEIKPNWKITRKVASGTHKIKVELYDKDVTQDDAIDINRVDKKRDLDFTVTSKCRIEGFSSSYKCGSSITRAGGEAKKAEITFSVSVK